MSSIYIGWLLVASSIAISALAFRNLQSGGSQRMQFNLDQYRARFSEAPKLGAAPAGRARWNNLGLLASAAAFLLVAGIGAATSFHRGSSEVSDARAEADGNILSGLESYAATLDSDGATSKGTGRDDLLPDVNTMIERLAARLKTNPNDANGWRMLGWSYFNTERYKDAADAYAKAMELDPSSPELKRAHDEATAKASGSTTAGVQSAPQPGATAGADAKHAEASQAAPHGGADAKVGSGSVAEYGGSLGAGAPPHDTNAAIRAMVDGLASRLEASPRDVDGWTRLMRSRVVLGEKGVAEEACRKALDVFKDDAAASGQIKAAAAELGLKAE